MRHILIKADIIFWILICLFAITSQSAAGEGNECKNANEVGIVNTPCESKQSAEDRKKSIDKLKFISDNYETGDASWKKAEIPVAESLIFSNKAGGIRRSEVDQRQLSDADAQLLIEDAPTVSRARREPKYAGRDNDAVQRFLYGNEILTNGAYVLPPFN